MEPCCSRPWQAELICYTDGKSSSRPREIHLETESDGDTRREDRMRRKLIFFTVADPASNPYPVWEAYHLARTSAGAGLEAEVRLADHAVKVAHPDTIAEAGRGSQLRQWIREGPPVGYLVSV